MTGYQPLKITGNKTGLVQEREEFLLPDDAYPTLQNAYVWREKIKRKKAFETLGRLRRTFQNVSLGNSAASPWAFNIYSTVVPPIVPEATAEIEPGSVVLDISPLVVTGNITGYTNDVDCKVTSAAHGLTTGDIISISGVVVVPESGDNEINGGPYTITVVDVNNFLLNVPSLTWGTYQSSGTWTKEITAGQILFDQGNGTLATKPPSGTTGTINYITGNVVIIAGSVGLPTIINFNYFPGLPAMGLRLREEQNAAVDMTIAFDTVYAYNFGGTGWQEFLPGTIWTGQNFEFFWTTNYWVDNANRKIFWATNYSTSSDPIRYTNGQPGTNWINFTPIIDASNNLLLQALAIIPFRGRLVAFNTAEGLTAPGARFTNRIRWAEIGNPFTVVSGAVPPNNFVTVVVPNAWRDDIRGKGGFLDIPTSEDIVSVGFVRDNLVIYCERSTWQLRYTGRSIAPFQIEKVNSELGAEGTFSTVQFDTSLVGIGDKGIVECDSYKSSLIDVKILDLVYSFQNANNGPSRVHGIRDFINRLAYWTFPSATSNGTFPDSRLLYNYENDSWAIFTDSLTCLGTYQAQGNRTWLNTHEPWIKCNFPWISQTLDTPQLIGGNQQGFILYLDVLTTNDPSLFIQAITGHTTNPTVITSPNHNMQTGTVIQISGIPDLTPFANLNAGNSPSTGLPYNANNGIFSIIVNDLNTFQLMIYNPITQQFSTPQLDVPATYIGAGLIAVRDNFNILSKKFNFIDDGQNIQLGYLDILMVASENDEPGAISLNVYLDYNDQEASNTLPKNAIGGISPTAPDTFFNAIIPTNSSSLNNIGGTKFWQRVFCPTRANFITLQYVFSNAQMAGFEQENDVQIDAQILWIRQAGRITQI